MPQKIIHNNGSIEWVETEEEQENKEKYKTKKKASDLSDADIKELVLLIARKLNLIP